MADRLDVVRGAGPAGHAPRSTRASWSARAGAVGRKLDFVIQEIGRELNTIASKAQDAGVAGAGDRRESGAGADARAGPERRVSDPMVEFVDDRRKSRQPSRHPASSSRPRRGQARPRSRTGWPSRSGSSSRSRTRRGCRARARPTASTTSSSPRTSSRSMVDRNEFAEWAVGPRQPLRHRHPHGQPRARGRQGLPVRRRLPGRRADPPAVARTRACWCSSCRRRWPSWSAGCAAARPTRPRRSNAGWRSPSASCEHFAEYDYLVVNDNLDTALKELSSIYVAARCTRARREHYGHALLAEARSRDGGPPSSSQ